MTALKSKVCTVLTYWLTTLVIGFTTLDLFLGIEVLTPSSLTSFVIFVLTRFRAMVLGLYSW